MENNDLKRSRGPELIISILMTILALIIGIGGIRYYYHLKNSITEYQTALTVLQTVTNRIYQLKYEKLESSNELDKEFQGPNLPPGLKELKNGKLCFNVLSPDSSSSKIKKIVITLIWKRSKTIPLPASLTLFVSKRE